MRIQLTLLLALLSACAPREPAAPPRAAWQWVSGPGPGASGAMARLGDAIVHVDCRGNTWVRREGVWRRAVSEHAPPPRCGHRLASRGDTLVLFGGNRFERDTWEWDGVDWSQRSPAHAPPGLSRPLLARAGASVLLFGGMSRDFFHDETWLWNGQDWVDVSSDPRPPGRLLLSAMATVGESIILFRADPSPQTWRWREGAWEQLQPTVSPEALSNVAMTSHGDGALLVGVRAGDGGASTETWAWKDDSWALVHVTSEPLLSPFSESRDLVSLDGEVLLLGDQAWSTFDGAAWRREARPVLPVFSSEAALTITSLGDTVIAVGEADAGMETWLLEGSSWRRAEAPRSPPPRRAFAAAARGDTVVLFGGGAGDEFLGDTWVWDGVTWTEMVPGDAPPARIAHGMATRGDTVVLFGGRAADGAYHSGTWAWSGEAWRVVESGPRPTPGYLTSLISLGDFVLLKASFTSTGEFLEELWSWDGATWSLVTPYPLSGESNAPTAGAAWRGGALLQNFSGAWFTWHGGRASPLPGPNPFAGQSLGVTRVSDGVIAAAWREGGSPEVWKLPDAPAP